MSLPLSPATMPVRRSRVERERIILDTAARLFYARGVHEVGMDELVRETGLSKPTVYRLFPSKEDLVGCYLERLASTILELIDKDCERLAPGAALHALLDAVSLDASRDEFRGCPFNNASIEYDDPGHRARRAASEYRRSLRARLRDTAGALLDNNEAAELADRLAVLVDGIYTNAAHLGIYGPAAAGLRLAHSLVDKAVADAGRRDGREPA